MKVLIVDDSALIRTRLVTLLNALDGIEIVGQAETVAEAISAQQELKPDAIILDLQLPDGNGLEVLRLIHRVGHLTAVVVLTNYPFPQYETRALAAGAHVFLNKAKDFTKVASVLQEIASSPGPRKCAPDGNKVPPQS